MTKSRQRLEVKRSPEALAASLLEQHYRLSSTQVNLPKAQADFLIKWGRTQIKDDDLWYDDKGGCGREDDMHCTVLYGLTAQEPPKELRGIVHQTRPFTLLLKGVSLFEQDDHDVVKLDVESEELHTLSSVIRRTCDNENKFPEYKPHVTIAYVKKGKGKDLVGEFPFQHGTEIEAEFEIGEMLFCGAGDSENPDRIVHLPFNRLKNEGSVVVRNRKPLVEGESAKKALAHSREAVLSWMSGVDAVQINVKRDGVVLHKVGVDRNLLRQCNKFGSPVAWDDLIWAQCKSNLDYYRGRHPEGGTGVWTVEVVPAKCAKKVTEAESAKTMMRLRQRDGFVIRLWHSGYVKVIEDPRDEDHRVPLDQATVFASRAEAQARIDSRYRNCEPGTVWVVPVSKAKLDPEGRSKVVEGESPKSVIRQAKQSADSDYVIRITRGDKNLYASVPTGKPGAHTWGALADASRWKNRAWAEWYLATNIKEQDHVGEEVTALPIAQALSGVQEGEEPTAAEIKKAAAKAEPPSDGEKDAGNYKKGHITLYDLDIAIENAKGSERSGKDKGGKVWSVKMPAHYGYIKRTEGSDGDAVDVYIGDHPESDSIFVVDQLDAETGKFDEHKCLLAFQTKEQALKTYEDGFSDGKGKDRIGGVTMMTVAKFKEWVKSEEAQEPLKVEEANGAKRTIQQALAAQTPEMELASLGFKKRAKPNPYCLETWTLAKTRCMLVADKVDGSGGVAYWLLHSKTWDHHGQRFSPVVNNHRWHPQGGGIGHAVAQVEKMHAAYLGLDGDPVQEGSAKRVIQKAVASAKEANPEIILAAMGFGEGPDPSDKCWAKCFGPRLDVRIRGSGGPRSWKPPFSVHCIRLRGYVNLGVSQPGDVVPWEPQTQERLQAIIEGFKKAVRNSPAQQLTRRVRVQEGESAKSMLKQSRDAGFIIRGISASTFKLLYMVEGDRPDTCYWVKNPEQASRFVDKAGADKALARLFRAEHIKDYAIEVVGVADPSNVTEAETPKSVFKAVQSVPHVIRGRSWSSGTPYLFWSVDVVGEFWTGILDDAKVFDGYALALVELEKGWTTQEAVDGGVEVVPKAKALEESVGSKRAIQRAKDACSPQQELSDLGFRIPRFAEGGSVELWRRVRKGLKTVITKNVAEKDWHINVSFQSPVNGAWISVVTHRRHVLGSASFEAAIAKAEKEVSVSLPPAAPATVGEAVTPKDVFGKLGRLWVIASTSVGGTTYYLKVVKPDPKGTTEWVDDVKTATHFEDIQAALDLVERDYSAHQRKQFKIAVLTVLDAQNPQWAADMAEAENPKKALQHAKQVHTDDLDKRAFVLFKLTKDGEPHGVYHLKRTDWEYACNHVNCTVGWPEYVLAKQADLKKTMAEDEPGVWQVERDDTLDPKDYGIMYQGEDNSAKRGIQRALAAAPRYWVRRTKDGYGKPLRDGLVRYFTRDMAWSHSPQNAKKYTSVQQAQEDVARVIGTDFVTYGVYVEPIKPVRESTKSTIKAAKAATKAGPWVVTRRTQFDGSPSPHVYYYHARINQWSGFCHSKYATPAEARADFPGGDPEAQGYKVEPYSEAAKLEDSVQEGESLARFRREVRPTWVVIRTKDARGSSLPVFGGPLYWRGLNRGWIDDPKLAAHFYTKAEAERAVPETLQAHWKGGMVTHDMKQGPPKFNLRPVVGESAALADRLLELATPSRSLL